MLPSSRPARAAAVVVAAALGLSSAAHATFLSGWNLVVRTNLTTTSEVDGSAIIGGTLAGGSSNFAVQGVTGPNNVALAVGGNVSGNPKQVNSGGNFRFSGTVGATVNLNGGGNAALDATIASQVSSLTLVAQATSTALKNLAPNGTVDGAGNMNAMTVLVGGQRLAIYNVSASQLSGLGQLNLNIGNADSVIINVSAVAGAVNLVAPPNLVGGFTQANSSKIIWNFHDATSLTVNNNLNGTVLAPSADLRLLGGGINGTVFVNSVSQMDAEIRRFTYNGYIPAPGAAGLLALGGLVAARRRR